MYQIYMCYIAPFLLSERMCFSVFERNKETTLIEKLQEESPESVFFNLVKISKCQDSLEIKTSDSLGTS
jgi:hypothetical protein